MKAYLIIFIIFIFLSNLKSFSNSDYFINKKQRDFSVKFLKQRVAGIIDKPRVLKGKNKSSEDKNKSGEAASKEKAPEQGDIPAVEMPPAEDVRPIPQGKEFEINIPGTKKRVLLFGETTIYYIKRKVSELRKNAYIKSLDYEVYADRLLYFEKYLKRETKDGKKQEHAQAWGNVRIFEKTKKVQIFGSAAFYYPKEKYMRVTGGAHMLDEKQKIEIHGQTMERYSKKDLLVVTGNVELKKPKDGLHLTANRMRYNTKTKHIVLTGNVRITQSKKESKRFIAGERVVINEDKEKRIEKIDIKGNGIIREYKKGKLKMMASADKINHFSRKDKNNKILVENTDMSGHVRIKTEKQDIMAMKVNMDKTPEKEEWKFKHRVLIKDKKNKDEIRGGYVFFNKKEDIMHVLENPQLYIAKEDATINSNILKSYRKDELTLFIGDVEIIQDNKKIYGEKALFNEKTDKMKITGNPFLIDEKNITYSEEIIFFTKKKEVRLTSKFHGVLSPKERGKNDKNGKPKPDGKSKKPIPVGNPGGPEIL